jgi:oligoribonuclease (3'-5' exoribonuclease)
LVQRIKDSHVSIQQAEKQTIDFLQAYVNPSASPMCGNTICQDRRFLYNYMPKLEQFFHYRHIDVSTLKELAVRWKPEAKMIRKGEPAHLALLDMVNGKGGAFCQNIEILIGNNGGNFNNGICFWHKTRHLQINPN